MSSARVHENGQANALLKLGVKYQPLHSSWQWSVTNQKTRLRGVRGFAQGHTANREPSLDMNCPSDCTLRIHILFEFMLLKKGNLPEIGIEGQRINLWVTFKRNIFGFQWHGW